jgi:hypothetical protein
MRRGGARLRNRPSETQRALSGASSKRPAVVVLFPVFYPWFVILVSSGA